MAGGTSLSLRFNHREFTDIDLFCEKIIGIEGYNIIEKEIREAFPNSLFYLDYPVKESDELIFMRFTLEFDNFHIKVEISQAFKLLDPIEILEGIRMASIKDEVPLKLNLLPTDML